MSTRSPSLVIRLAVGLLSFPERLLNRIASLVWGAFLGSPGIRLHHTSHIKGAERISLGGHSSAGRYLWLEAVMEFDGQTFDPKLVIGSGFHCSESVHIACISKVTIGAQVLLGSKVLITDHNHGVYKGPGPHSLPTEPPNARALVGAPVTIGDRVFIGDGVIVLPGSVIGTGAVVAANSVVSGTLQPFQMYAGMPAKPIKAFDFASQQWIRIGTPSHD